VTSGLIVVVLVVVAIYVVAGALRYLRQETQPPGGRRGPRPKR